MPDKNIIIIDDSKVSRLMIKAIIQENEPDWVIFEATNANEALDISKQQSIDYYSVDLNMPGIDGFQLIEQLKDQPMDSKFALLTANIQEQTHKRAEELGIACINKPITETSIMKMLAYFNG